MSRRCRGNNISSFLVNGVWVEGVSEIRQAVFSHFEAHCKVVVVERPSVENHSFRTLSYNDGTTFLKLCNLEEVKAAVWDCDSNKALGPDGVTFDFITVFQEKLKDDLTCFVTEFHRNGKLTKGINCTFIHLISKVDSPQRLNNFLPISLVGCVYKLLAKVLANRLWSVIGGVISPSLSAFVKGRQILDGILIANEGVDKAKKYKKSYYYSRWISKGVQFCLLELS